MLPVTKIQHFSTGDGPGIRTTVFLKGCPMRCVWCHNPETASSAPPFFYADTLCVGCGGCERVCPRGAHHITQQGHRIDRAVCTGCMRCVAACPAGALERCVRMMPEEDVLAECVKDTAFYGKTGGVTLSGGEPTLHAREILTLLRHLRERNLHTCIETCGCFPESLLPELIATVDLFLWDVKDTDADRHLKNTGVPLRTVTDNLLAADRTGAKTVMRCIMIRSVNLNGEHLQNLIALYGELKHCAGIELIPYHAYGAAKYTQLGETAKEHKEWIPLPEEIAEAEAFLARRANVLPH